jgi:hypothetical protein
MSTSQSSRISKKLCQAASSGGDYATFRDDCTIDRYFDLFVFRVVCLFPWQWMRWSEVFSLEKEVAYFEKEQSDWLAKQKRIFQSRIDVLDSVNNTSDGREVAQKMMTGVRFY